MLILTPATNDSSFLVKIIKADITQIILLNSNRKHFKTLYYRPYIYMTGAHRSYLLADILIFSRIPDCLPYPISSRSTRNI